MARPRPRRTRNSGSIFPRQTPAGLRWVAQIAVRGPDGRRRFITRWRHSERSAKLALDGLLASVAFGGDPRDDGTPLEAYLMTWLATLAPTVAPRTFERYATVVRLHLVPLLGAAPIGDLRPADVRRLIADRLAAGKAPATVVFIVTVLRQALGQAVRDDILVRNPTAGVAMPRIDRAPIEALTATRAREIVAAVRGDPLEALWLLLLGSGLRRGEALALDWADVDLERATVRVRAGKTRASLRTVPIPAFVVAALRAHRSAVAGPVFRGAHGRLTGSEARHGWERVIRLSGLPQMTIHSLRHGHATLLLQGGTPMRVIADQLGHSNPATTARVYAHVVEAQQRAAVEGLDEIMGETP